MQRSHRNIIWIHLASIYIFNGILYLWLQKSLNKWIAIVLGSGIALMTLTELFIPLPYGTVTFVTNGDPDILIPKGTQLENPDKDYLLVTTRSARVRWWTRLWCRITNKPFPTELEVPIRKVDKE